MSRVKENDTQELVVMDFASATITSYTLPLDKSDRADVEKFIENKTPHRLSDIEWMVGMNGIERVEGDYC